MNELAQAWLDRALRAWPPETARFLLTEKDRFRNPVGHAFREGLPVLLEELLGGMDPARIGPVLDELVRIRAVQDCRPGHALAFLFALRPLVRDVDGADERIDRLALQAFDVFLGCREQMQEIRSREASRAVFVRRRLGAES
jgi:hypothetical protein